MLLFVVFYYDIVASCLSTRGFNCFKNFQVRNSYFIFLHGEDVRDSYDSGGVL